MSKIKLNVLFKKMQKDDKKEVLEFHVVGGTLPHTAELNEMTGNMVVLNVPQSKAGTFPAEFNKLQRDSKKAVLQFKVKGDSEEKSAKLYGYAGSNVELEMEPSQMSIDEYYDSEHEGVEYTVDSGGVAEVKPDQMTLEDVSEEDEEDIPFADEDSLDD